MKRFGRIWRDIRFRTKIIVLFVSVLLINSLLVGGLYYNYAFKDTLKNYYESAEDMVSQMNLYLTNETQSITKRVHAVNSNGSFYVPLQSYLQNPASTGYAKLLGDAADFITEMQQGDRYVHSVYIQTPASGFDNFTQIRDRDFRFEESQFYQYFEEHPEKNIAWFPAAQCEIFTGNGIVIPVVYRFKLERKYYYTVVNIQQSEIAKYLKNTYSSYDKIFIADKEGRNILNCGTEEVTLLDEFSLEELKENHAICQETTYQGKRYLATCSLMKGTDWRICALRSADSLVGNLNALRYYIILVIFLCAIVSILLILIIANGMTAPLGQLAAVMGKVTQDDLSTQFDYPYKDEVGNLASSFNYMVRRIHQLVTQLNINIEALKEEKEMVKRVQAQKRKAELRALQAQINPHFLYNTLNAITWQAADQGAHEISILSNSLGKFFRISLSRGKEIITIKEELEHVVSYLNIQKIRYKDKLSFSLQIPPDIEELYVIKLVLQPLVENAIYHGIKLKETSGQIWISACRRMNQAGIQTLVLRVEDNGMGIKPERLEELNRGLRRGGITQDHGYGIFNVNERLKLYYGDSYGLTLESQYQQFTTATIVIPIQTTEG